MTESDHIEIHSGPLDFSADVDRFRLLVEGVKDYAILMLDPEGRIVSWNAGAQQIKGYTAEEVIGRHFSLFYTPEAIAARHPQHELEIVRAEGRYEEEDWRVRKDGTQFWASVVITALTDERGELWGFGKVTRDLTERRAQEQERERFRLLVEGVKDYAILMLDPEGHIVSWNAGAQQIKGYTAEEVIGQHFSLFYTPEAIAARHPQHELEIVRSEGRYEEESWRVRKDGTQFWASVVITALTDERGELWGYGKVTRDLTERRAQEQEQLARELTERASRAKTEFLSRMSHELRTPLNAVLGFAQALALDELSPGHREAVDHIRRGGELLLALIDELLDISTIEAGRLPISLEPVDVGALLAQCVQLVSPLAAEKGIQIVVAPSQVGDVYAVADQQRLNQVLLNLLTNAIKYNRPQGTVSLQTAVEDGRAIISVGDSGRGIDPTKLPLLFTPFERLGAETGEIPGTGLGLALSQRLAELMGATITVESELGKGSVFHVSLQSTQAPTAQTDESRPLSDLAAGAATIATVLYIEDNLANLQLVEHILPRLGSIEVISAMQGTLGLQLARTHRPDMILLDLHLPDMPGEDVATALMQGPQTRQIPIVILTAAVHASQRRRLLDLGVRAYLTKPFDVPELLSIVKQTIASKAPTADD